MENTIRQILPLWGVETEHLEQICPSVWEVNGAYIVKAYQNLEQMERNSTIQSVLAGEGLPVAGMIPAGDGRRYVAHGETYFLMTEKLRGSHPHDIRDGNLANEMGRAIARLHKAFRMCEKLFEFWDNSLLEEMLGWTRENLRANGWQVIKEEEYRRAVGQLEGIYGGLPRQLIHRDVHLGNFLFERGEFSGYIDFDLSQKNIRIFDLCYFLAGLIAEQTQRPLSKNEWLCAVSLAMAGYESIEKLTRQEKMAIPCVMECIEILCAAYFVGIGDVKRADDAGAVLHFIAGCREEITKM